MIKQTKNAIICLYMLGAILDSTIAQGDCDDLEAWCPEIDAAIDCCSPFIQTKCPSSCDTCPAIHCIWDNWKVGTCSAECGPGTRINTREKLVEESNGGTCTGENKEILECQ